MGYVPLKPTIVNGQVVAAQNLAVGSSAVSFATFNAATQIVGFQVLTNNVICTLDGTTASATNGAMLYATQGYHWDVQTAQRAIFIQAASASATLYAQEFQSSTNSTAMPDASIFKGSPISSS